MASLMKNRYWSVIKILTIFYYITLIYYVDLLIDIDFQEPELTSSFISGNPLRILIVLSISFFALFGWILHIWLVNKDLAELSRSYNKNLNVNKHLSKVSILQKHGLNKNWLIVLVLWPFTYPILPLGYLGYRWYISKEISRWRKSAPKDVGDLLSKAEKRYESGEYEYALNFAQRGIEEIEGNTNNKKDNEMASLRYEANTRAIELGSNICDENMSKAFDAAENGEFQQFLQISEKTAEYADHIAEIVDEEYLKNDSLSEIHSEFNNRVVELGEQICEESSSKAFDAADNHEYQEALKRSKETVEYADNIISIVDKKKLDEEHSLGKIIRYRDKCQDRISEWERKWLVNRIESLSKNQSEDGNTNPSKFLDILTELENTDALSENEVELLKKEAYTAYSESLRDHALSYYSTAEEWKEAEEYESALEAFKVAAKEIDWMVEEIRQWDVDSDKASQMKQELINKKGDSHIEALKMQLQIGISEFKQGEYEDARESFTKATEMSGKNVHFMNENRLQYLENLASHNAESANRAALNFGDGTPEIREIGDSQNLSEMFSDKENTEQTSDRVWTLQKLQEFDSMEFENLVATMFDSMGYETSVTSGSRDFGVDVWADDGTETVAIQVKRYQEGNTVGREVIQKLESNLARGEADRIVVVTSSSFAQTARNYAADSTFVRLIDGEEMVRILSEQSIPVEKS